MSDGVVCWIVTAIVGGTILAGLFAYSWVFGVVGAALMALLPLGAWLNSPGGLHK